jgi:hypothetical protein
VIGICETSAGGSSRIAKLLGINDGSFHELKLLSGGASDHKHHPHRQNETLRFMTHAFPPMSSLNIEHLS